MARRAEHAKTNGFDSDIVHSFVEKLEGFLDDLESERGTYMARCKAIRESMKSAYDDAGEAGIPKRELKAVIKRRGLEARIEKIKDDLEDDQAQTYDMLLEALGDFGGTPLGQAALGKAANGPQPGANAEGKRRPGRPRKNQAASAEAAPANGGAGEPQGDVDGFKERLGRPEDGAAPATAETSDAVH